MYEPSLRFLQSIFDGRLSDVRVEAIKRSSTPATVYRLWLTGDGATLPGSVICKRSEDLFPDDPDGHRRETRFYSYLLPKLDIPKARIFYAGPDPDTPHYLVIMEDVSQRYRFPSPKHTWDQEEIKLILRTYARLHTEGQRCLVEEDDLGWMLDRHEKRFFETAAELPAMVADLVSLGIWPEIPGFDRLVTWTSRVANDLSGVPETILHNDVYPPNCGLPLDKKGDVLLMDWEMVGRGLAELDLAFMFLQPFGSHRKLDRAAALAFYWRERERLQRPMASASERERRQRYADALWALWLIPVAHKMALSPFPPASPPRIYWESMFAVLADRLAAFNDDS